MRAAVYARTAVASRERIDQQIAICKQCAKQRGWSVSDRDVFTDDGFSGGEDQGRPGLQSLLHAASGSPAPFDIVVLHDFSRLGRYQSFTVPPIEQLKSLGISVYAVDSAYDSRKND